MDLICFVHRYCASNRGDCYGLNVHTKILKNFSILCHSYLISLKTHLWCNYVQLFYVINIQITWCMYWLTLLQSNILRYAFQHSFTCTIFLKMSAVLYWVFFYNTCKLKLFILFIYLIKSTEFLPASKQLIYILHLILLLKIFKPSLCFSFQVLFHKKICITSLQ